MLSEDSIEPATSVSIWAAPHTPLPSAPNSNEFREPGSDGIDNSFVVSLKERQELGSVHRRDGFFELLPDDRVGLSNSRTGSAALRAAQTWEVPRLHR